MNQLRNAVEAASDDEGWATLSQVGFIITQQAPDFDPRSWGYPKLSDLMKATTMFDVELRSPGEGKREMLYARYKRRRASR